MSENLFGDPSVGVPDERKQRQLRIDTYADLLLADPPIPSLDRSQPGREKLARRLAERDVARYERMLWRLDLEITPKPVQAVAAPAAEPVERADEDDEFDGQWFSL